MHQQQSVRTFTVRSLQVGTLFNTNVAEAMAIRARQDADVKDRGIDHGPEAMAKAAREQSRVLAALPSQERADILHRMADALEANVDEIMTANQQDVNAATGRIDNNLLQRLVMKPKKIGTLANGIRQLANMDEPIGQLLNKMELAKVRAQTNTSTTLDTLPDSCIQCLLRTSFVEIAAGHVRTRCRVCGRSCGHGGPAPRV